MYGLRKLLRERLTYSLRRRLTLSIAVFLRYLHYALSVSKKLRYAVTKVEAIPSNHAATGPTNYLLTRNYAFAKMPSHTSDSPRTLGPSCKN